MMVTCALAALSLPHRGGGGGGREAFWSELLTDPERMTHLAEAAGRVFGFVYSIRVQEPTPGLELTSLYVLPEHAGAGVGPRLYGHFESERRDDEVGLFEVWEGNVRAIGFYVRRGWVPTEVRRPGPGDVDFVTYRLAARCDLG